MMKLVYTCDHCGKKLDEMIDFPDLEFDDVNEYFRADLCRECLKELTRHVTNFCGKQPKEVKDGD